MADRQRTRKKHVGGSADRSYFTSSYRELEEAGRWGAVGESAAGLAGTTTSADIRPHVP